MPDYIPPSRQLPCPPFPHAAFEIKIEFIRNDHYLGFSEHPRVWGGYRVTVNGDHFQDGLCWDEMLGLLARITCPSGKNNHDVPDLSMIRSAHDNQVVEMWQNCREYLPRSPLDLAI